jgi:hypothetical protein
LACALISLATFVDEVLLVIPAVVGLLLLGATRVRSSSVALWLLLLQPLCLAALSLIWPTYKLFPHPPPWVFVAYAVAISGTVLVLWWSRRGPKSTYIAIGVLALAAVAGSLTVAATKGFGIDVTQLHLEAAEAISSGSSIYGDAVSVPNGSPFAPPDSDIVGYPYPPLTALLFAVPSWMVGDPRWINLVAWLVVLGVVARETTRQRSLRRDLVLLLFAASPAWPLMLQTGWTELPSLALLALALATWDRAPVGSAVALGAALATKQYFVVALPLVLLHPHLKGKRSMLVLTVAALTAIPYLLIDPAGFWAATVDFHANTPARPDSVNVVGLLALLNITWTPPLALTIGLPLFVSWWVGVKSLDRADFAKALAISLGVFFLLTSQAFSNYWFLVAMLSGIAALHTNYAANVGSVNDAQSRESP